MFQLFCARNIIIFSFVFSAARSGSSDIYGLVMVGYIFAIALYGKGVESLELQRLQNCSNIFSSVLLKKKTNNNKGSIEILLDLAI